MTYSFRFILAMGLLLMLSALTACYEQSSTGYHNDYQIGQYTSPAKGYSSNSYWIEGPEGVVLIDTQFLPSAALEAVSIAESVSGKSVVMAIVLDANPDRFNGVQILTRRGIRVVSAKLVTDQISEAHNKTWPVFHPRLSPDYPDQLVLPEVAWTETTDFSAAGLNFRAYVIRQGVSKSHLLIELDSHLFTGNLVVNKYHPWPGGDTRQWLLRLDEIAQHIAPRVIYPGRGYPMQGDVLIKQQGQYLRDLQQAVARVYTGGEISELDKQDITQAMIKSYPHYGLDRFLRYLVPAEWKQLREHDHHMMGK